MFISNIANQQATIYRAGGFNTQQGTGNAFLSKADDMLKQVSSRMLDTYERTGKLEAEKNIQAVKLEQYTEANNVDTSELDQLAVDVLEEYLHVYNLLRRGYQYLAQDVTEFRDQLQAMDKEIQGYQDMLDNQSFEDGMTEDYVRDLLAVKQQKRESFLQEGADRLNVDWINPNSGDTRYIDNMLNKTFGTNPLANANPDNFRINTSSDDIYAEIDKMLGSLQGVANVMSDGMHRVLNIIEKKGYGQYKYQQYMRDLQNDNAYLTRKSPIIDLLEKLNQEERDELSKIRLKSEPGPVVINVSH